MSHLISSYRLCSCFVSLFLCIVLLVFCHCVCLLLQQQHQHKQQQPIELVKSLVRAHKSFMESSLLEEGVRWKSVYMKGKEKTLQEIANQSKNEPTNQSSNRSMILLWILEFFPLLLFFFSFECVFSVYVCMCSASLSFTVSSGSHRQTDTDRETITKYIIRVEEERNTWIRDIALWALLSSLLF